MLQHNLLQENRNSVANSPLPPYMRQFFAFDIILLAMVVVFLCYFHN